MIVRVRICLQNLVLFSLARSSTFKVDLEMICRVMERMKILVTSVIPENITIQMIYYGKYNIQRNNSQYIYIYINIIILFMNRYRFSQMHERPSLEFRNT